MSGEKQTRTTNPNYRLCIWLPLFPWMVTHKFAPDFCVYRQKNYSWSNEWGRKSYLKLKPPHFILRLSSTTSAQMFGISCMRVWCVPPPSLCASCFTFSPSLANGLAPTVAQFNIYTFPSVCFPPQREVGFHVSDLPQQRFGSSF